MDEITTGGLFDGRVTYRQFAAGHRSGFEPVLLAASVPAKAGQIVLEAGTGAGAALLCLAARVPGLRGYGLELDAATAELANENFKINNLTRIFAIQGDATAPPFASQTFDHILANPPWFNPKAPPRRMRGAPSHTMPRPICCSAGSPPSPRRCAARAASRSSSRRSHSARRRLHCAFSMAASPSPRSGRAPACRQK